MAVGGIYDSHHNSYSVKRIQTTYIDRPSQPERQIDEPENIGQPGLTEQQDNLTSTAESEQQNRADQMADLEQVSLKFNRKDSFGYIGRDSRLDNLDVQKAISDMQKDQVLQGYQYFVGSVGSLSGEMSSEDGTVVMKPRQIK